MGEEKGKGGYTYISGVTSGQTRQDTCIHIHIPVIYNTPDLSKCNPTHKPIELAVIILVLADLIRKVGQETLVATRRNLKCILSHRRDVIPANSDDSVRGRRRSIVRRCERNLRNFETQRTSENLNAYSSHQISPIDRYKYITA